MALGPITRGLRWTLDRVVSVGYGGVYDYIFEYFEPYQKLQREVLELITASVPQATNPRDIRILELECGPGNFSMKLAEAGFTAVGVERYASLVELAREKRRARKLANLSFRHADLATNPSFKDESFDYVVNIHSLYAHPDPDQKLKEAHRVLKAGGHAVFVNHTRRIGLRATFGQAKERDGLRAAMRSLLWVLPNSIFEVTRKPVGPNYWQEDEFAAHLRKAGFTILEVRRTFLNGASILAWTRKDTPD